jgi:hypothetical protein
MVTEVVFVWTNARLSTDKVVIVFDVLNVVQASMERYCRQWPIRKWEPRGEPEFPKILHSTNPNLYEVLQPLTWTVANGSEHKQGSTTLYVRIRKNEKGVFRIIHVEKRDRHVQSQSNS